MPVKIIIFGTGDYYKRKRDYLNTFEIVAFADNDLDKHNTYIDGKLVISPDMILSYEYDYICTMSLYEEEIIVQLIESGIQEEKILRYSQIGALENTTKKKKYDYIDGCDIVLITNVADYSGGSMALLNLSIVIKKMGYKCVMLTISDGPLRAEYQRENIAVYEEINLSEKNEPLIDTLRKKQLVICNTIILRPFVEVLQRNNVSVLWWIHESNGFLTSEFKPYHFKVNHNLHVYGVGPKAIELFNKRLHCNEIDNLLYTVKKTEECRESFCKKVVTFSIIGLIADYKGQDIFIDAIKMMPDFDVKRCRFEIIGKKPNNRFTNSIDNAVKENDHIVIIENMSHDDLMAHYSNIDVIVNISRFDTMPTVVVEGMMNKRCCIVSPNTGITNYIENYKDGIILKELKAHELSNTMSWILNNRDKAKEIGLQSYAIYEKYFCENKFEDNVRRIIQNCVK